MELSNWNQRTELLISKEGTARLKEAHILVAGLGGVGGAAAEFLVRAGIGKLTLVDADFYSETNLNRQIGALISTVEKAKTQVMYERLKDINPHVELELIHDFIIDEKIDKLFESTTYSFVADAIDSLAPKVHLIKTALQHKQALISSMGAGGKMDPTQILVCDIEDSRNDGLARMLRKRLHKLGIRSGFKVVFSTEKANPASLLHVDNERNKKTTLGTISYMPMLFGAHMASHIIVQITGYQYQSS
jgi:tRNA A37 threonylcarbamoyladenosine dehydratase